LVSVVDQAKFSLTNSAYRHDEATRVSLTFDPPMSEVQAHCWADEIVKKVGIAHLVSAGVINADGTVQHGPLGLLPRYSGQFVEAEFDCSDDSLLIAGVKRDIERTAAHLPMGAVAGGGALHVDASCIDRHVTRAVAERFLVDLDGQKSSDWAAVIEGVIGSCV